MPDFSDIQVPQMFDERQSKLHEAAHQIQQEADNVRVANTSTGFAASAVDLGFIQDNIKELYAHGRIKRLPDLQQLIDHCVHRVKQCYAYLETDQLMMVRIVTKDDFGWYEYQFGCYREGGWDIIGVPTKQELQQALKDAEES